jgi:hypothetical protein
MALVSNRPMHPRTAFKFDLRMNIDKERKRDFAAELIDQIIQGDLSRPAKIEAVLHRDGLLGVDAVSVTDVNNKIFHSRMNRLSLHGWTYMFWVGMPK